MRSWRSLVHIGSSDGPSTSSNFHKMINLFSRWYICLSQVLNENAPLLVGSNLQIRLTSVDEISQLLHVKFHHGYFDSKLYVLGTFWYGVEHLHHHSWDYTRLLTNLMSDLSFHSMGFSWRCLSISKNSSIETLYDTIYHGCCCVVIHIFLRRVAVEYFIKGKS